MNSSITLEEQEKILRVATGLIREEANWIKGAWKCPVYEYTPSGKPRRMNGEQVLAKDDNGMPLYKHCVEGAVNQAVYNVLGEERAIELGAAWIDHDEQVRFDGENGEEKISYPTEMMQLNRIAFELYREEMGWSGEYYDDSRYAMGYNDGVGTHKGVLNILKTRLKEVVAELRAR